VEAIDDGAVVVDLGARCVRARRAKSCLVAPSVGDLVLAATTSAGDAYVCAVLESERQDVVLDVDGQLRMTATEGVEIASPKATSITSSELHVDARLAWFAFDAISAVGASLRAEFSRLRVVAESIDTVAERIAECVKEASRVVTGLDHLHAEQIDHVADETLSLRAKHAVVAAATLAKIDGDQVHIG
jgi:hypothetical protein